MRQIVKKFLSSDSGAVTVDWVVLTAAVVGLGFSAMSAAKDGITSLGGSVNTELSTTVVDPNAE